MGKTCSQNAVTNKEYRILVVKPFKHEAQTALFKDPVRTA